MKLSYQALDQRGHTQTSVVEVAHVKEAVELLRRQGLYITELRPLQDAAGGWVERARGHVFTGRAGRRDLVLFTRQMAMLLGAGTGVVPALAAVRSEMRGERWRRALDNLKSEVEQGSTLANAMFKQPHLFDGVSRGIVAAGEATASLPEMFNRLALLARQELEVRNRIVAALTYPAVLTVICMVVIGILLGFVLPRFAALFTTLHADLPGSTRFMLKLSAAVSAHWLPGIAALAVLAAAGLAFARSEAGRLWVSRALLVSPGVGPIVRHLVLARLCRLLGLLIQSRVPLLDAISLTTDATGHRTYRELLQRLADDVGRGESMARALSESSLIPPAIVQAVAAGETSGNVGTALTFVAECYDEDNRHRISLLSRVIEPAILILLGLLVGAVAVSLFLPLFDLTSVAGG